MTEREWWGKAPKVEYGKGEKYRVKDSWCHMWFTRFIGSREECEAWVKEEQKPYYGRLTLVVEAII